GTSSAYKGTTAEYTLTITGVGGVSGTADKTYTTDKAGTGVTFGADNKAVVTLKAGEQLTIKGLPTGTYTIVENETAAQVDGYDLTVSYTDANHQAAVTEGTAPAAYTVTNTYTQKFSDTNTASFEILKTDGKNALDGAVFTLYDSYTPATADTAAVFGKVIATSAQKLDSSNNPITGRLVIDLPDSALTGKSQTFYLAETTAPGGYTKDSTVWTVTVTKPADDAGEPAVKISEAANTNGFFDRLFTWVTNLSNKDWANNTLTVANTKKTSTDYVKTSLSVNKIDADTKELIKNGSAAFTLYSDAELKQQVNSFDTVNGTVAITGLGKGPYYLKETKAPANYNAADTVWEITTKAATGDEKLVDGTFVTTVTYSVDSVKEYKNGAAIGNDLLESGVLKVANTYQTGDLKITKALGGVTAAGADGHYTFTITALTQGTDGNTANTAFTGTYQTSATGTTVSFTNGAATVTINGAGSITVKGLPIGSYDVQETGKTGYDADYDLSVSGQGVAAVQSHRETEAKITNTFSKPENDKKGTGTLTIFKKVNVSDDEAAGKSYSFTISGTDKWGDPYESTKAVEANKSAQVTVPYGTYTVSENTANVTEIKGYTWTSVRYGTEDGKYSEAAVNQSVTISSAKNASVYALNSYTRTTGNLTVAKAYAEKSSYAPSSKSFTLEITGVTGTAGKTYLTDKTGTAVTFDETTNKAVVELKAGEKLTINNLPTGDYVVTEQDAKISGYTWSVRYSADGGKIEVQKAETALLTVTNGYTSSGSHDHDDPDPKPDPETPIEDPDVPKGDLPTTPTTEPTTTIEDQQPPKAAASADAKTGDSLALWILAAGVSGLGLVWISLAGKKRRDHDAQ
ncbi:MAG: hypothetical protein LKJ80_03925, partial [Oscillibacter sp.]|nr:hypothetical protein [Oscillibacter sp.]